MRCKEKGGKMGAHNPVFQTLNQFYNYALTKRDAESAAALMTGKRTGTDIPGTATVRSGLQCRGKNSMNMKALPE